MLLAGAVGFLFVAIALAAVVASLLARANVGRAAAAEEQALEDAGATATSGSSSSG